ncbi:MAG: hypothetical protein AB1633_04185 [Elusimicrobiota bacterium]
MKKITPIVNGKRLPLNNFVKAFISSTLKGMLSSLRSGKNARKVKLEIEY